MVKKGRRSRWAMVLCSAGLLLQTGSCALSDQQLALVSSVLSDTVFFFLDNALVRLTT